MLNLNILILKINVVLALKTGATLISCSRLTATTQDIVCSKNPNKRKNKNITSRFTIISSCSINIAVIRKRNQTRERVRIAVSIYKKTNHDLRVILTIGQISICSLLYFEQESNGMVGCNGLTGRELQTRFHVRAYY